MSGANFKLIAQWAEGDETLGYYATREAAEREKKRLLPLETQKTELGGCPYHGLCIETVTTKD